MKIKNKIKIKSKSKNKSKSKSKSKSKKNKNKKFSRNQKGAAPWRISVHSYNELNNIIKNIPNDSRIWIVKNGENNSIYESNKKNLLESLFDNGITNNNISDYTFNIL